MKLSLSPDKALVVLSGGQDSVTCLAWSKQEFKEVYAVTFNYNQRHALEIESAVKTAQMLGVQGHEIVELGPILRSSSPLVNLNNEVGHYSGPDQLPGGIEPTFIPGRNILFLLLAANRAVALGAQNIVTGVCVTGDTMIDSPIGQRRIRDLVGKQFWTYAYDTKNEKFVVARASHVRLTRPKAQVWKLTHDHGTLLATPDHRLLTFNRGWVRLDSLKPGDSLVPLNRRLQRYGSEGGLYSFVNPSPSKGKKRTYTPEHHFVFEALHGNRPHTIHHKNHNHLDNSASNLVGLSGHSEHQTLHMAERSEEERRAIGVRARAGLEQKLKDPEYRSAVNRKRLSSLKYYYETPEGKESRDRGAQAMRDYYQTEAGVANRERKSEFRASIDEDFLRECSAKGLRCVDIAELVGHGEETVRRHMIRHRIARSRVRSDRPDNHKVIRVEPYGVEDVYCMEVSGYHNFVANGLVVHNCEADSGGYPDCTQPFIDSMQHTINQGFFGSGVGDGEGPLIQIHVPLMYLTKRETVELAKTLPGGLDALAFSHTCYDGCYPPNPSNHASILRARGFHEASTPDPLIERAINEGKLPVDYPNTGFVTGTKYEYASGVASK